MKKLGLSMIVGIVCVIAVGVMAPAGAVNYPPTTGTQVTTLVSQAAATDPVPATQSPGLPRTGTDVAPLVWLGGALIATGVVLATTRHRRRSTRS